MAVKLPPQPVGMPPGHSMWNDWYEKLRTAFNSGQVTTTWANIDFAASDITDILNRSHEQLQSLQGGTAGEHYHLTSAQHSAFASIAGAIGDLTDGGDSSAHFHSADRARANHTGTQTMSTISDLPTLASGTYTPSLTDTTNVASSTSYVAQYMRVGSVVTVSGLVDINPTAASTNTVLDLSLPIASNFANSQECAGTAAAQGVFGYSVSVLANTTGNTARMQFISDAGAAEEAFYYTYTYRII